MNISPGVSCTASTTANGFEIATSHPRATVACTFVSAGPPNLACNPVAP